MPIRDKLLQPFENEPATATTFTSGDLNLPAGDWGVGGGDHAEIMFAATADIAGAAQVTLSMETADDAAFTAGLLEVGRVIGGADHVTAAGPNLYMRPQRQIKEFTRIKVDFDAATGGTFTAGFAVDGEHRRNYPKGYSH